MEHWNKWNKDLQEDKEPLFDSFETVSLALRVNAEMVAAMRINPDRCASAVSDPLLLATDLADYLVRRGVPFRKAHELVGKAVAVSVGTGTPLNMLSLEEFKEISPEYGEDVHEVFNLDRAFSLRTNPGAPSADNTARRIAYWQNKLA